MSKSKQPENGRLPLKEFYAQCEWLEPIRDGKLPNVPDVNGKYIAFDEMSSDSSDSTYIRTYENGIWSMPILCGYSERSSKSEQYPLVGVLEFRGVRVEMRRVDPAASQLDFQAAFYAAEALLSFDDEETPSATLNSVISNGLVFEGKPTQKLKRIWPLLGQFHADITPEKFARRIQVRLESRN